MSEEESTVAVEQITREPLSEKKPVKAKDPKKVAAGKRLAEHNKRANEALKEKMARDGEKAATETESLEEKESTSGESKSWIPQQMSFTTVLSVVGLGLTAFDMYMRYKRQQTPESELSERAPLDMLNTNGNKKPSPNREEECTSRVELHSQNNSPKNSMIGML